MIFKLINYEKGKLLELAAIYNADPSETNLNAMREFLKKETIYFRSYFDNTEGKNLINLSNYQENGAFVDFEQSQQYDIPPLLKVRKPDGTIVYVSLDKFILE